MAKVSSAERVWVETFTGLEVTQFARLLKVVRERGGDGTLRGRPWCLALAERVLVVAVYYRNQSDDAADGPAARRLLLHGVPGDPMAGPLLAIEPVSRPADAPERTWIVDGTLIPVRDRRVAAPSRAYRFSVNVQVIVDADTRLVIAAARPVTGTTADAHARRASGLSRHCEGVTVLGDGAYLNCGMAVPHRKRPGRALLPGEEDDNAARREVRARVEHVIGRLKNYKILRDCRQHGDGLHHAVQAVAHMHNLALAT